MLKQDMQKKHARVLQDSAQVKEHYKMYKVGKIWLFAGLFTVSMGAGLAFGHPDASADVAATTEPATNQVAAQQNSSQAKEAVIGDNAQTASSNSSNTQAATGSTATTPEKSHNESAVSASTQTSADNSAQAKSSAASTTEVQAPADNTAQTKANVNDTQTVANSDNQASSKQVQTTNLGDVTDQSTIKQAKTAAAATYAKTGTPQQITALSGIEEDPATTADPVQAVSAMVENTTKTYDNKTNTPATVNVKLSSNLTAPTGWFVTGNPDEYQIVINSGDLDLSQVNQNAGTYNISLSADGLIRLNAVKANQDKNLVVTTADVTAGKLTISKAPVAAGAVTIIDTSKLYDNDAATDPTSYKVKLASGLVAPTGWTANSDGTYNVTVASGDLTANIGSQKVGTYKVALTAAGLQKINAANPNYDITADKISAGNFRIADNTKLIVGVARISTTNPTLPSTLTVSVSKQEKVPDDWTINYNNEGSDSIVYNVPLYNFDFSQVDTGTVGPHSISLTDSSLDTLNDLNQSTPNLKILRTNVQAGEVLVTADTANAAKRGLSTFGAGGAANLSGKVLNDGSGVDLDLTFFRGTPATFNNFTDIVIIPAGLAVAKKVTSTVNGKTVTTYTKSTDPTQDIIDQVSAAMTSNGVPFSNFTVKQLNNYKGRQAFALTWGTVDTSVKNDTAYPLSVVVDPDVTDVTAGKWGDWADENDAAILYATDDNQFTQGKYVLTSDGSYPNIPDVANGLGLTNANTLEAPGYQNPMWIGQYTIKHVDIEDTYNLTNEAGQTIATAVTTQGKVGDTYDPLLVVPAKFTAADGTQYVLDQSSIPASQTFKATTAKLAADATVAPGITYTAKYKQVVDTTATANQAKVSNQTIAWGNLAPASYRVTLPSGLKAPTGWIKTTGNTYDITVSVSGDLDTSSIDTAAGTYNIKLSKEGLTRLAAANPDYLFDNQIAGTGTLTIAVAPVKVTVTDTAGNTLKTVPTIQIGSDTTTNGDDVTVPGIPVSQLNHITFNFADDATNISHIKTITISADKTNNQALGHGTFYDGRPDQDVAYTAEQSGAATPGEAVAKLIKSYNYSPIISFDGTTPQITKEFTRNLKTLQGMTSIDVVYNQKASATVTYVDDDKGGSVVPNTGTTLNGFGGDVISYTVTIPANYVLADDTAKNPTNVTLTTDDTDNLTIHLKHKIVSGTKTTNRVINYVIDNPSAESVPQTPATVTQQITWNTLTDKVTGETVSTAKKNVPAVAIQPIIGYTATVNGQTATEVPAFFAGAANANDLKNMSVTVTYTPNTVTANVQVPSNKGNQTVTGVSGTVDNHVQVTVPDLPGYSKDKTTVPATVNPDGTITVDNPLTSGKVTYTPGPQSINVTFVDQDKNLLGTVELTGVSDGTVDYTSAYQKQQGVLNQGYTLKDGNNNGLANAPKNFDHDDKSTPNYVVVLSKINQVNVTVNLVPSNDKGKPISNTTPTKVTGLPGTTVTAPNVPGYTTSTPTLTIPETRDDTVKVTYTPDPQKINVHFVDDKGADLGTTTLTGVSDGDVDYKPAFTAQQALLNQGYTLKKGNNNGLDSATKTYDRDDKATPTYEVVLTKINNVKASFTITPVLPNGDPVPNSTATTAHDYPGTKVNVPDILGYTPKTDTVTIPDDRTPGTNVTYTPNTVTTNVDIPSNKGPQTVTNVTGKTGDHLTITVPTIPGYTPDKTTVPATVNPDGTITVDGPSAKKGDKGYVTYTANDQIIIVNFTDDKTGKVIGTAVLKGKTDGNVDRGPAIAEEQNLMNMGKYTPKTGLRNELTGLPATFTSQSQTFTVQLTKINDVKVTVNLVPKDADGNPIPNTTPTTVHNYPGTNVTVPEIPGYTPTNTQLTIPPKNGDVPVVYTANTQSVKVKYVDDNNNGTTVGTATTLTGVTDGSATWNTNNKPAGYDLANGQAASGSYTFAASNNQDVVIHLTHHISTETITATRTITFKGNTDVDESKLPSTIVQKVNWTISTDEVTGDVTFTPDGNSNYQAVPLHSIPSDNPEITYVPEFTYVTAWNPVKFTATKDELNTLGNPDLGKDTTFLNADETYYYNAIGVGDPAQSMQRNVKYVDDDNNGAAVGTGQTISGPVGNTINWTAIVPANYQLAPNQAGSGSIKLDTNSTDVIIHLVHQTTTAHVTSSRVIDFKANDREIVDESKLPQTVTQTINWTIVTDKVTGAVTLTPDKDSYPGMTLNPIVVTDEITYQSEFMQVSPIPVSSFTVTPDMEDSSAVNKLLAAIANNDFSFLNSKETYYYNAYGIPATGAQGHFKDQVPDAPSANQYTINFVTPNGDVIGHMPFVGNPGNKVNVSTNIPKGYVLTPGNDGVVTVPDKQDPKTPIIFNVTTPAGEDADGVQVWTKDQVPDAPYANQYTVNFVTPNGDVIGHISFVGNSGNHVDITPSIPKGYVPTPGKDGNITITDTNEPGKPITFNVTTPAGQDADGVQVWTKDQVPDAPYANQYTVNFVTPNGDVVGTATLVGNPGNKFVITGNVPNGYTLVDGADGVVEISNDQNPAQPISIGVVPNDSSDNGGTTDVPGGSSTGEDTNVPTDNPETTIIGDVPNNTVAIGKTDNNTVTGGKADNSKVVTDKGNGTAQATGYEANSGTSTGLVQQSSNAEAAQASANGANANTASSNIAKSKAAALPQTNEQQSASAWAMIGLGLMSMLSLLGITKKKREDEK
ncbi:mucus-binding protein, LPXTG-motif cell wall anchor [Secundilactobacillus pentosiphilus]|uniref:Mucus-binding protein, LPXTG-motif cell wall anchor n=1 Tax=Secundilactobacillus pentosiphilus TaxID=1714682 RepID=A0A1Z5IUI7_9LACO|nr:MBG domain-containing protein [Secundilactobacillus pentosiphilus]GAX05262.1 mucus-binding protein, LPXTG-motif cell wall anchor [Secundilactobacillus pentosiphilus]